MVNYEKTRLMTKCAIYEKNIGKEDIKLSAYYKSDFVRFNIVKSMVFGTLGFLCCFILFVLYNMNIILEQAFLIDFKSFGYRILGLYIVVVSITVALGWLGYSSKYRLSRKRLAKYYKILNKINKLNEEDERLKDLEE